MLAALVLVLESIADQIIEQKYAEGSIFILASLSKLLIALPRRSPATAGTKSGGLLIDNSHSSISGGSMTIREKDNDNDF
jgi:hypothetical protein